MRATLIVAAGAVAALLAGRAAAQRGEVIVILLAAVALVALGLFKPRLVVGVGAVLLFAPTVSLGGVPANEFGAALIAAGAVLDRGRPRPVPWSLVPLLVALLAWIAVAAILHPDGLATVKRLTHILIWIALVAVTAAGRVPRRPLFVGFATGLTASVTISLLGIGGIGYGDRLVALFGDPNAFAVAVAILTPFLLAQAPSLRWRAVLLGLATVGVLLAESRTAILALVVGLAVLVLLPHLRWVTVALPIVAAGGMIWATANVGSASSIDLAKLTTQVQTFGDRSGSDALRARIAEAGTESIAESPWTGHGPGATTVRPNDGEDRRFFFHDSYQALTNEIGVVGLLLYLALLVVAGARWARAGEWEGSLAARAGPAALSAAVVGAAGLGEVLLDFPMALAIGWTWLSGSRRPDTTPEPAPPETTAGDALEVGELAAGDAERSWDRAR